MTRIVEYVGKEGVISSPADHFRFKTPRPGDLIRWNDGSLGRIWEVGTGHCEPDEVHVCNSLGSAFLGVIDGRPYVSISGGPFTILKTSNLIATERLAPSTMWNFADRLAGANQGCDYTLMRPLFEVVGWEKYGSGSFVRQVP